MKRVDLTGRKFGERLVLGYLGNRRYRVECSCGKLDSVLSSTLVKGIADRCRNCATGHQDLTDRVFGDRVVVGVSGRSSGKNYVYHVKCKCGREDFGITGTKLLQGSANQCAGCSARKESERPERQLQSKRLGEIATKISITRSMQRPAGEVGLRKLLGSYRRRDSEKGLATDCSEEQLMSVVVKDCVRCGSQPTMLIQMKSSHGKAGGMRCYTVADEVLQHHGFLHNTADRIDNSKGHDHNNIQPMCHWCNKGKGEQSNEDDLARCKKIAAKAIDEMSENELSEIKQRMEKRILALLKMTVQQK
jgi:hypothetical protein